MSGYQDYFQFHSQINSILKLRKSLHLEDLKYWEMQLEEKYMTPFLLG
jgi:hypothetical protein